ncbi:hypothetical protein Salat_1737600 [Sesamum alatum]|uniref:Uncharacterized protein n=1 Tax=Sesamum alatum TaxID=300844 RepID=A0AAE2CKF1_9LAMI|nr:hypothetical protein Salat_1737600 [Sesamum alatum]
MNESETGVNVTPPIVPPVNEEEEATQAESGPFSLTEPQPSMTQPSVQGPTMFEQLQHAQPHMTLHPRLNIRAPPPMTGVAFMPSFSRQPTTTIPKPVYKEQGQKFVELSKWPSQSSTVHEKK